MRKKVVVDNEEFENFSKLWKFPILFFYYSNKAFFCLSKLYIITVIITVYYPNKIRGQNTST